MKQELRTSAAYATIRTFSPLSGLEPHGPPLPVENREVAFDWNNL